jgi:hypothetical protein
MSAVLYYGAFFMISVKLYEPLMAGTAILAFTLVVVPVSGITGAVSKFTYEKFSRTMS